METTQRGRPKGTRTTAPATSKNKLDQPIDELPDPPEDMGGDARDFYIRFGQTLVNDRLISARDVESLIMLADLHALVNHPDNSVEKRFSLGARFIQLLKLFGSVPAARREIQASRAKDPGSLIPQDLQIGNRGEDDGEDHEDA